MRRTIFPAALFLFFLFSSSASSEDVYRASDVVVGAIASYTVRDDESLIEIARRFGLGHQEIVDANPDLDPYAPGRGAAVVIPSFRIVPDGPADGIVINLAEMRLYSFFKAGREKFFVTYPIGIGSEGNETPTGKFRIKEKLVNPFWYVPSSIKAEKPDLPDVVRPGPDNPLGTHALRLTLQTILIHGTNKPWAVGRKASHGCIRLYPEDIPRLFGRVRAGTPVTIVRQPIKVGTNGGRVYVEVHGEGKDVAHQLDQVTELLIRKGLLGRVSATKLLRALSENRGVPVDITN